MIHEGWGAMRPGDRVHHYYRDGDSLCGKVGLYYGPLDEDDKNDADPLPSDCKACFRKLRAVR